MVVILNDIGRWAHINVKLHFFINYMYIDNILYGVAFDSMVTNFSRAPFT